MNRPIINYMFQHGYPNKLKLTNNQQQILNDILWYTLDSVHNCSAQQIIVPPHLSNGIYNNFFIKQIIKCFNIIHFQTFLKDIDCDIKVNSIQNLFDSYCYFTVYSNKTIIISFLKKLRNSIAHGAFNLVQNEVTFVDINNRTNNISMYLHSKLDDYENDRPTSINKYDHIDMLTSALSSFIEYIGHENKIHESLLSNIFREIKTIDVVASTNYYIIVHEDEMIVYKFITNHNFENLNVVSAVEAVNFGLKDYNIDYLVMQNHNAKKIIYVWTISTKSTTATLNKALRSEFASYKNLEFIRLSDLIELD